jgi:solute carrier family 35, member F1/2
MRISIKRARLIGLHEISHWLPGEEAVEEHRPSQSNTVPDPCPHFTTGFAPRMPSGDYEYIDDSVDHPLGEHQKDSSSSPLTPSSFLQRSIPLLHGQYISILISGTGFFASLLSSKNSNCPILLSLLNYTLLSTYLLRLYWRHHNSQHSPSKVTAAPAGALKLSQPLWVYFLIGLIDVEANIIVNSAYNYTSITSIMLLDCFSIPCVMLLSVLFLHAQFNQSHYYGVLICLAGMGCIILTDTYFNHHSSDDDDEENVASNPLKGDILCLIGTCLYATSNVIQEKLVKTNDRMEFLGMLGVNGFCIGIVQFFVMELHRFQSITWTYEVILYTIGYSLCLFFMYSNTSSFLTSNDATLFNLSLLTSDVYAVLFAYFVFQYEVHWMYFVAFFLTATGLTFYYRGGQPTSSEKIISRSHSMESSNRNYSLDSEIRGENSEEGLVGGDATEI